MKLLGVAQHSPVLVRTLLKDKKLQVLGVGQELDMKQARRADYILVLRRRDFLANQKSFNSPKLHETPVILFDSILRLTEITPIQMIDQECSNELRFRLRGLDRHAIENAAVRALPGESHIDKEELLASLIRDVQVGSLLCPLMTLLYQLPSSSQNAVKLSILEWLYEGKTVKDMKATLIAMRNRPPKLIAEPMLELLSGKIAKEYQAACAWVRERKATKKPVSYKAMKKRFEIEKFEMRYILMVLKQDKAYKGSAGKTLTEIYNSRERNNGGKPKGEADG